MTGPRVIVLGWDSATFDIIDPLVESGRLPVLASLIEKGWRAPLRSTWPPMTDCAWTSAFTGRDAGGHGIIGSWYRAPGSYECRYFSSRDRRAPAVWELTDDVRHLVWNVPMTFPPEPIAGAMVAGYGAPPGSQMTEPKDLQSQLAGRWALDDLLDRAPHGSLERFLDDLLQGLRAQGEALPWAIRETGADAVYAVWPHIDRAQHFFWRFRDRDHPMADAVTRVYEAMDRATGDIVGAFPDADVIVVSDHGAGPLYGDVNLGAWLVDRGDASYSTSARRSVLSSVAWAMPPVARRAGRRFAPSLARKAMAAKLSGQLAPFDWSRTRAFFGFHSDLWLNLEGREPNGIVPSSDAEDIVSELSDALVQIEDPATGRRPIAEVHRRDDIYRGPHAHLAPDLVLDTWSAGYRVAPGREASDEIVISPEALAGVRESWSADHRPLGIFVAAGPHFERGSSAEMALYDVCPTVLALLEAPVPEGLNGTVATDALAGFLTTRPVRAARHAAERGHVSAGYSDDEAAAVAEHLKDLGYIE
ncbi:MAG: alkaline phosphatase family protein [Actinobacteria bacterium]|nr:alkaline phosphatase family protein [Actinomycetota bacterium]